MQPIFDASWHQRALQGDGEAVRLLVDAMLVPLHQFCWYRVGANRHWCEEAVQETLVRAIRQLEQYQPQRAEENVFPWLTGLARNVISQILARERKALSLDELWRRLDEQLLQTYANLESAPLEEDVLVREETRELVNVTMSQLPPHYREALEAKYVEGRSVQSLAQQWQTTEKAMESLLCRARKAFRATFETLCRPFSTAVV